MIGNAPASEEATMRGRIPWGEVGLLTVVGVVAGAMVCASDPPPKPAELVIAPLAKAQGLRNVLVTGEVDGDIKAVFAPGTRCEVVSTVKPAGYVVRVYSQRFIVNRDFVRLTAETPR